MAKGGTAKNPPVIEKIGKTPPSAHEARRQIFRVFRDFSGKI